MKKITSHGFTLIETMIAVTILSLSVAGPLYTASRAIVAAEISRDKLTASYLAQEAIEYVRALRDDKYLAQYPAGTSAAAWDAFKAIPEIANCGTPNTCTLGLPQALQPDVLPLGTFGTCPNGCPPLAPFVLGTGATSYLRTFQATEVGTNDEKIVSTVSWSFHNVTYSVSISDHLTPWQ